MEFCLFLSFFSCIFEVHQLVTSMLANRGHWIEILKNNKKKKLFLKFICIAQLKTKVDDHCAAQKERG